MINFIESLRTSMRRQRTERALRQLDDRLLRDIGMDRHLIGRASADRTYTR